MKNYDFSKAKQLIEENKENLESASLGMHEDWFWTAETIWENGNYTRELLSTEEANQINEKYIEKRKNGMSVLSEEANQYDNIMIAGIYGSTWATPTLQLQFNDGTERMVPCYAGDSDSERPAYFGLGCMSSVVQANIQDLED